MGTSGSDAVWGVHGQRGRAGAGRGGRGDGLSDDLWRDRARHRGHAGGRNGRTPGVSCDGPGLALVAENVAIRFAVLLAAGALACSYGDGAARSDVDPTWGGALESSTGDAQAWAWDLPRGVDPPPQRAENPTTAAKVALGRQLFYDPTLSGNETYACATCHEQALAFTDGMPVSTGSTGEQTSRNAPSLVNSAYASFLTWSNLVLRDMEAHAIVPLFNDQPIEMGASFFQDEIIERLAAQERYVVDFAVAFPERPSPEQISWTTIVDALSAFQRSLVSFESPYDRWLDGDASALTPEARRGLTLFTSPRLGCSRCHAGRLQSLAFPTRADERPAHWSELFRNTGLYNVDGRYPQANPGIVEFTGDPGDDGKHRIPSLRNVALTAPYMHDGSIPTLDAVLDHYAAGGRTLDGMHAGVGADHPNKDALVSGFELAACDRRDLIAFLLSLTDESVLKNPQLSDPAGGP
ncbi:MAG: di-heme enzyme [Myxococcales bacterium FL481]|nr:MAG: di-heme enzyme [Myxococcales bacterium FL481]